MDCGLIQLTNPNTRVSYLTNSTVVGSIAQYKCIPGYFISENGNQSICQENGSWTNIDTECERKTVCVCMCVTSSFCNNICD